MIKTKIDKALSFLENSIIFLGMSVAFIASVLNVVMRYVFSDPLTWPPELARYCHILIVFVGASAAVKIGNHLSMDVLYVMAPSLKKACTIFQDFTFLAFGLAVIYMSKDLVYMQFITGQNSIALNIPFYILYSIPAFGSLLMVIRSVILLLSLSK
jgi:C4-dicarboxylate transporter, DctQ subunit